jgi:hypothetical protein
MKLFRIVLVLKNQRPKKVSAFLLNSKKDVILREVAPLKRLHLFCPIVMRQLLSYQS